MRKLVYLDELLKMQMPVYIKTGRIDCEMFRQTDGVTRYAIDKLGVIDDAEISRTSEWVDGYMMSDVSIFNVCKCSRCRNTVDVEMAKRFKYCPYCGSRMVSER